MIYRKDTLQMATNIPTGQKQIFSSKKIAENVLSNSLSYVH